MICAGVDMPTLPVPSNYAGTKTLYLTISKIHSDRQERRKVITTAAFLSSESGSISRNPPVHDRKNKYTLGSNQYLAANTVEIHHH